MILISHRGNISGALPELENNPSYIEKALLRGYNVEIDVWKVGKEFYLGHDSPDYAIDIEFLKNDMLWCHAKNIEALDEMISEGIHCFWHHTDRYTITSNGIIWSGPDSKLSESCVWVMPEKSKQFIEKRISFDNCLGVCTDIVEKIEMEIESRRINFSEK